MSSSSAIRRYTASFFLAICISPLCGQSVLPSRGKNLSVARPSHAKVDLCFDLSHAREGVTLSLRDNNISVITPRTGSYSGMHVTYLSKYMRTAHDRKIIEYDSGPINVKLVTSEEFRSAKVEYISSLSGKAEVWRGGQLLFTQPMQPSRSGSDQFTKIQVAAPLGETFTEIRFKGTVVYLGSLCLGF